MKPAADSDADVPDVSVGLVDTSVLIDLPSIDGASLPDEIAVSAVSLAELAAGPHATQDPQERARRQDRLQWVSETWDPLAFDGAAARAYGRVYAAARAGGQTSRARLADLMIAATALAHGMPLYTRNGENFVAVRELVTIVEV